MTGFKMIKVRSTKSAGFTLVELMIVVAIIGIIVAFGYPMYTDKVIETRRADAKAGLASLATLQEKFFTECNRYAIDLTTTAAGSDCDVGGATPVIAWSAAAPWLSPDGHYIISIIDPPAPGPNATCTAATCFMLQADPSGAGASGLQQRGAIWDGNLRVDHAGRTSWDKGNAGAVDAATWMYAYSWTDK